MMGKKTIYGVQPYWFDGRRLARGLPAQFRTLAEAERMAGKLYETHAGVVIYAVTGCPEFDTWGDPRPIRSIGFVQRDLLPA